jgi:hypothetical protein
MPTPATQTKLAFPSAPRWDVVAGAVMVLGAAFEMLGGGGGDTQRFSWAKRRRGLGQWAGLAGLLTGADGGSLSVAQTGKSSEGKGDVIRSGRG